MNIKGVILLSILFLSISTIIAEEVTFTNDQAGVIMKDRKLTFTQNYNNITNNYYNISGGGGNPFNQTLNTTSSVRFQNMSVGKNYENFATLEIEPSGILSTGILIIDTDSGVSALQTFVEGYLVKLFSIRQDGFIEWGDGDNAVDTNLYREDANILRTDDSFMISGSSLNLTKNDAIIQLVSNTSILAGTPTSGGINIIQTVPEAKGGIWWNSYDLFSDRIRPSVWLVAHYNSTSNPDEHQHFSIEVLNNQSGTASIDSAFTINYGSDVTRPTIEFPSSDVKFISEQELYFGDSFQTYIKHKGASTGDLELKANADILINGTQLDVNNKNVANIDDLVSNSSNSIDLKSGTTVRIFPFQQSNLGFMFTNTSDSIMQGQVVGGTYFEFLDNVNVSNGLDVCISGTGGKCLSNAIRVVAGNTNINGSNLQNVNNLLGVSTFDMYPNNQSTFALRIDNNTGNLLISALGTTNLNFSDKLTTSSGNDFCIEGGECLSTVRNSTIFNNTYHSFAYNQTGATANLYGGGWNSTFNSTYSDFAYNQTSASGWLDVGTTVRLITSTDKVAIGSTATPLTTTHIFGNLTVSENATIGGYLFVNNSRIGIGTASPSHPVNIVGHTNISGHLYHQNTITYWNGSCLNFNVSGSTVMSIGCT